LLLLFSIFLVHYSLLFEQNWLCRNTLWSSNLLSRMQ
jgi:hypothetical protein